MPSLLPVCLPQRWAKIYTESVKPFPEMCYHRTREMENWSLNELEAAMSIIISQDVKDFKLCLFIDGLDECEGQSSAIAEYLNMLARVPWLKICLSSRPLLVFENIFGSEPSLRLQDLTRTDINHYVKSKFQENSNYQRLCLEKPVQAPTLIGKIVSRADGVFLWVKLVVQDIISGLTNRDSLDDLQERIEIIPLDLEELFSSMLSKIDPFYSKKAALIFLIARAAKVRERNIKPLNTLSLSFALDFGTTRFNGIKFDLQDLQMRNVEIRDHLKVRCAGLLETGYGRSPGFEYLGYQVSYLHRSVREYLERPDIRQAFSKLIPKTDYEPYTPLMYAYIKELEVSEARKKIIQQLPGLSYFMTAVLHYAQEADLAHSDAYIEGLDTFATLTHTQRSKSTIWAPKDFSSFLHIAVNWNLYAYVKLKLNQLSSKTKGAIVHILLAHALAATDEYYVQGMEQVENSEYLQDRIPPSPRMVALLLAHGAQSNRKMKELSALREWSAFEIAVRNVCAILPRVDTEDRSSHQYSDEQKLLVSNHLDIVKIMLDNGADANTCLNYRGTTIMSRKLLTETMRNHWRSKESYVDQIFEKRGGKLEPSMVRKWIMAA